MKSMTKLTRYLVNKFVAILVLSLCIAVSIIGCSSNESEIYEESQESETINTYETEAEETTIEVDDAQEPQLLSCYEYEIQQKTFNFSIDNGESYHIPYVQIQGCPDKRLQWKINHTLWKDACWLFDCAQLDIHIYVIWDDDDPLLIPPHRFPDHDPQEIRRQCIKDPLWKDQPEKEQNPAESAVHRQGTDDHCRLKRYADCRCIADDP